MRAQGLGLAAISYDAPEILKTFAANHGITYPLLSDTGSATIRRWGLLNAEATGRDVGIPHPGTFVIDRQGRIATRAFEQNYRERATATAIAASVQQSRASSSARPKPGVNARVVQGKQLVVTTSQSDAVAAPGTKLSLYVDIDPKPKMHVYSPEQGEGYIPITIRFPDEQPFKVHDTVYPKASNYYFAPLKETFKVFNTPVRLRQDITIALTPDLRKRAEAGETLTIPATIRYQACDDAVCYRPEELKVEWRVKLQPLQRR